MSIESNEYPENPQEPKADKTRQMTFTVGEDGQIRADFGEGIDPVFLNPGAVPEVVAAAAVTEGLISRSRGYTSRLTGAERTPAALRDAVAKAFANLMSGVWKIERAAGAGQEFSIEVEAAFLFRKMRAEAKGEEFTGTLEEAAAQFASLDDEQKKKLKATPRYQLAFAEVKAARQAAKAKKLAAAIGEDDDSGF
jgi:hypothetical protein